MTHPQSLDHPQQNAKVLARLKEHQKSPRETKRLERPEKGVYLADDVARIIDQLNPLKLGILSIEIVVSKRHHTHYQQSEPNPGYNQIPIIDPSGDAKVESQSLIAHFHQLISSLRRWPLMAVIAPQPQRLTLFRTNTTVWRRPHFTG